jgi:hypothetical protein
MLDGQAFVWDGDKASSNASAHGVRFEQAREAFLDPLARYEDASPEEEARMHRPDYRVPAAVCRPCDLGRRCAPHNLRATSGARGKETL